MHPEHTDGECELRFNDTELQSYTELHWVTLSWLSYVELSYIELHWVDWVTLSWIILSYTELHSYIVLYHYVTLHCVTLNHTVTLSYTELHSYMYTELHWATQLHVYWAMLSVSWILRIQIKVVKVGAQYNMNKEYAQTKFAWTIAEWGLSLARTPSLLVTVVIVECVQKIFAIDAVQKWHIRYFFD